MKKNQLFVMMVMMELFKLSDFMKELSYVYAVFTAYYAFIDAINGNPATVYNLYEEGTYFDTLDIF